MAQKEICEQLITRTRDERKALLALKRKQNAYDAKNDALGEAQSKLKNQDHLLKTIGCPIPEKGGNSAFKIMYT